MMENLLKNTGNRLYTFTPFQKYLINSNYERLKRRFHKEPDHIVKTLTILCNLIFEHLQTEEGKAFSIMAVENDIQLSMGGLIRVNIDKKTSFPKQVQTYNCIQRSWNEPSKSIACDKINLLVVPRSTKGGTGGYYNLLALKVIFEILRTLCKAIGITDTKYFYETDYIKTFLFEKFSKWIANKARLREAGKKWLAELGASHLIGFYTPICSITFGQAIVIHKNQEKFERIKGYKCSFTNAALAVAMHDYKVGGRMLNNWSDEEQAFEIDRTQEFCHELSNNRLVLFKMNPNDVDYNHKYFSIAFDVSKPLREQKNLLSYQVCDDNTELSHTIKSDRQNRTALSKLNKSTATIMFKSLIKEIIETEHPCITHLLSPFQATHSVIGNSDIAHMGSFYNLISNSLRKLPIPATRVDKLKYGREICKLKTINRYQKIMAQKLTVFVSKQYESGGAHYASKRCGAFIDAVLDMFDSLDTFERDLPFFEGDNVEALHKLKQLYVRWLSVVSDKKVNIERLVTNIRMLEAALQALYKELNEKEYLRRNMLRVSPYKKDLPQSLANFDFIFQTKELKAHAGERKHCVFSFNYKLDSPSILLAKGSHEGVDSTILLETEWQDMKFSETNIFRVRQHYGFRNEILNDKILSEGMALCREVNKRLLAIHYKAA